MDYEALFQNAIDELKSDGRYRLFAELERHRGQFPNATHHGHGAVNSVLDERLCPAGGAPAAAVQVLVFQRLSGDGPASAGPGGDARGAGPLVAPARAARATSPAPHIYHAMLERELADCTGQGSRALLFHLRATSP